MCVTWSVFINHNALFTKNGSYNTPNNKIAM